MYALSINTGKMIKTRQNVQKVAQGLRTRANKGAEEFMNQTAGEDTANQTDWGTRSNRAKAKTQRTWL